MKRVIYSLYVDVPIKEHYGNSKNKHDTKEKASITVNAFKKHYDKLVNTKITYSEYCEADFIILKKKILLDFIEKNFLKDFPMFTGYEIIKFLKQLRVLKKNMMKYYT